MQDYEKLGVFYLGKEYDLAAGRAKDDLLLYDARDLTTHGVILGMTGSGKTGLALSLLEEAALDGIPALAIDPKGDLGNLLLTFPELKPEDFRPWLDESEAARRNVTPDVLAAQTAETWRKGLTEWGQDGARIRRLREAADIALYTPGSPAGRPLQILRTFAAPSAELMQDATALRDRVLSAVSGLLGLAGVQADPLQSREHILLSTILDGAWRAGRSLDLAALIAEVQKPPFERIGVFDLESFFPAKDRFGLAIALNNLLAAPGFSAWLEGEPLDVQRLLYTPEGKPRIAILSIAHLSDAERMFFVTILLNEVLAWVRAQPGSGTLRALLYMDEIYGYFPPTANPPCKTPMLTLLKQARAYGLGIVLATQNPVDLDYKGLANTGTWWIGRLQTERDKLRVLDGLEGAAQSAGAGFDRAALESILAGLGSRVFLMRNVHENQPVVFQSRWALCYLRGPMTLSEIRRALAPAGGEAVAAPAAPPSPASVAPAAVPAASIGLPPAGAAPAPAHPTASPDGAPASRPMLPPDLPEYFMRPAQPVSMPIYHAGVIGSAKLHFTDAKTNLDTWSTRTLIAPLSEDGRADWEAASEADDPKPLFEAGPAPGASFGRLPAAAARKTAAAQWQATLRAHLYEHGVLEQFACPALKMTSKPGELEGDFRVRLTQALRERRDAEMADVKARYGSRLQTLADRVRRAEERVQREQAQAGQQKIATVVGLGATLLGALMGRRAVSVGTVGRAATTLKSAGRIGRERADVARAGESLAALKQQAADLERQFETELDALRARTEPASAAIETVRVRPRKSDITITLLGLCWMPEPTGGV